MRLSDKAMIVSVFCFVAAYFFNALNMGKIAVAWTFCGASWTGMAAMLATSGA